MLFLSHSYYYFFLKHHPTSATYPLPLHDALPICPPATRSRSPRSPPSSPHPRPRRRHPGRRTRRRAPSTRSEEHTSELQSQSNLVCRLLLEKKKKIIIQI